MVRAGTPIVITPTSLMPEPLDDRPLDDRPLNDRPFDAASHLWPATGEAYFRADHFEAQRQIGGRCVSTTLAMLTGQRPEDLHAAINTQDPVSWSLALSAQGMKLAYCPTDARKLRHYMDELVRLDDLFTLSYYTTQDPQHILADPDDAGWVTGSHIVLLHRDTILDPASGRASPAREHQSNGYHTKRIFRVVPVDHPRGL